MTEWVTQRQAAELLGVHPSAVPKMIRRGDLRPRTDARPSLSRAEVVELAQARAEAEQARRAAPEPRRGPRPPDDEHEWLPTEAAAVVMGCSVVALRARANRERIPSTVHQRRRWFRLDHLELALRAEVARRTMDR